MGLRRNCPWNAAVNHRRCKGRAYEEIYGFEKGKAMRRAAKLRADEWAAMWGGFVLAFTDGCDSGVTTCQVPPARGSDVLLVRLDPPGGHEAELSMPVSGRRGGSRPAVGRRAELAEQRAVFLVFFPLFPGQPGGAGKDRMQAGHREWRPVQPNGMG